MQGDTLAIHILDSRFLFLPTLELGIRSGFRRTILFLDGTRLEYSIDTFAAVEVPDIYG